MPRPSTDADGGGPGRSAWVRPLIGVAGAAVVVGIVFAILAATGSPPFSDDDGPRPADQEQAAAITDVTHAYFEALSSGDAGAFTQTICPDMAEAFGDITDREPLDKPLTPSAVTDIRVDGDSATASVTVSQDGAQDRTDTVEYRNLDGWLLCQVP